jgi:Protein of unknown function (DUF2782)
MHSLLYTKNDAILILSLLLISSSTAWATEPPKLEPLPPPPVFDAGPDTGNPDDEPFVTITKEAGQTVEEYRANGKVYMIKITPKHGPPYYLVDERGDGKFTRQESLDSGFRPPRWVIKRF